MITIQSAMLVVLGFSIAGLMACVIAPAYRRRAARLATLELKRTMPLTEAEIAADKDRIRADYAIRVHKLETNLHDLSIETSRQLIEINRRDARISALESDVARLATINEEHENARRVLELTITDRLPKVEQRLAAAKKLLFERDREIAALTQTAQRQAIALEEATQINTQQRNDIHRLNATLTTRAARHRDKAEEQKHETEIALRTEIEALRARVRDQGDLITRLQSTSPETSQTDTASEMSRLRANLAEAERALQNAQSSGTPANGADRDTELRALRSTVEDQTAEIARLKAALVARSTSGEMVAAAEYTKLNDELNAVKARRDALDSEAGKQADAILELRAEVAAANEKLARQSAFYLAEMQKLAAGTRPVAAPQEPEAAASHGAQRMSLAERMNAPRIATVQISNRSSSGPSNENHASDSGPADASDQAQGSERRPSLLQRITGLEKPVA
ncbi:MAG: hypothetical protein K2Q28_05220 [Hyphomicrobium sp.]|nr:hypothetical protein [Hyphomicrobium sp.]